MSSRCTDATAGTRRPALCTLLCAVALLALGLLPGRCRAYHDYPRVMNYFTGFSDLAYCEALSRWDVVVLNWNVHNTRPEMAESLRALNPGITIITYFPAACVWADYDSMGLVGRRYGDKVDEADWWLYDTRGNRIGAADYAWFVNLTNKCPKDSAGKIVNQWLAGYVAGDIISSGVWDGVLLDGLFENAAWINNVERFFAKLPAGVDADRDGRADAPESLDAWWSAGVEAYLSNLRQEVGDSLLLLGNGVNYSMAGYLNGGIREAFPTMRGGWEENMFAPYGYLSMCRDYRQNPLNLTTIICWWVNGEGGMYGPERTGAYERFVRFTLSSALLGDGYYVLNGNSSQLWWEDLYDLDLGVPTSEAYLDTVMDYTPDGAGEVWRRDFSNGVVYCNPSDHHLVLDDGTWLMPEDGRIKTFSLPVGTVIELDGNDSQRRFDQSDDMIDYTVHLANGGEHSSYCYVWANLLDGTDTLAAQVPGEYLIGAGGVLDVTRHIRIPEHVHRGTYLLEVLAGGEDKTVVARDTATVSRVIDFEKLQKQHPERAEEPDEIPRGVILGPQPVVGRDEVIWLELPGSGSPGDPLVARLYDVTGRLVGTFDGADGLTWGGPQVGSGSDAGTETRRLELDLTAGAVSPPGPGVYFLIVETGNEVFRKKVVIVRN